MRDDVCTAPEFLRLLCSEDPEREETQRLTGESLHDYVQPDGEHGQADQCVVDIAFQDGHELHVPVRVLDIVVHVWVAVHTPDRHLVRPVQFGVAVQDIRLPINDHSQRQKHAQQPYVTV